MIETPPAGARHAGDRKHCGRPHGGLLRCVLGLLLLFGTAAAAAPVPELVERDGRFALLVDGAPFLVLGAQTHNSSNYPAMLPTVWPAAEALHANTVAIPVGWEQVEPEEGRFDFSFVDTLLADARRHGFRLVLLWFATWKNNSPAYAPEWVKLDNRRFPRVVTRDGRTLNSLSPHFRATLEADRRAFVALMRHLAKLDEARTVIMVQVQNEAGTYGSARDYSKTAEALFRGPVPDELVEALGLPGGDWRSVFGRNADEFFHAWHIARYVDEVAAAGKAAYALPMYVNAALRNPFEPGEPGSYESGGPTDNMLAVWKGAAPHLDLLAPDIYFRDHRTVTRVMDLYARPDNALYVSEIGNAQPFARYVFATLGRGGIGFCPFGMDYSDYSNYPLGAERVDEQALAPFAQVYDLLRRMDRAWAGLAFDGRVWGVAEPDDEDPALAEDGEGGTVGHTQSLDLGKWIAEVSYGRPMFGNAPPHGNDPPAGGALFAEVGPDEYIVAGLQARVTFRPAEALAGRHMMLARVEEGRFEDGRWIFQRVWNGDQVDWGLNFSGRPHVLKVRLATYETGETKASE